MHSIMKLTATETAPDLEDCLKVLYVTEEWPLEFSSSPTAYEHASPADI